MKVRVKSKKELLKILDETRYKTENRSIKELSKSNAANKIFFKVKYPSKEANNECNPPASFDPNMLNYCGKIIEVESAANKYALYPFYQIDSNTGIRSWGWQKRWVENLTKIKIELL